MKKKDVGNLILSRAIFEGFSIGEEIVIQVISIKRNIVTLKVTAPKKLQIDRLDRAHEQEDGINYNR